MDYKELLASIAKDKGDNDLYEYIMKYEKPVDKIDTYKAGAGKFNITKMPEATCDGCQ
jgi:hypothetical protein